MVGKVAGAPRVFISYSHSQSDEVVLADALRNGLQQAGCTVFIDEAMLVGTDWVAEIEHRIHWCDHFVVLLSEQAIASEMVQGEVRLASAARHAHKGRPSILPVRVRYFGPLDYELDSLLGRIQYAKWESPADSARALDAILTAMGGTALPEQVAVPTTPPTITHRPLPRIDPRMLSASGGALPSDDPLYVAREADDVVKDLAKRSGQTIVIKASRQMGKSSLLVRYLAECMSTEPKKTIAFIDLSVLSQEDLAVYSTFLSRLATTMLRSLRLARPAQLGIKSQQEMTWFLEDEVLASTRGPLVLAFDAVDRVLGRPYQADFFSMLRAWHNSRSNILAQAWKDVDLVLVISTEPYLLISDSSRSIFNVGRTIDLEPFTLGDYRALNEACGGLLTESQLRNLWKLLRGQPYLTRLAFYRLASPDRLTFDELMTQAADERGPFGEHLRAMLLRLHTRRELLDGLQQVLRVATAPSDDVYYRLFAAGVVRRETKLVVPANELYMRFFGAVLA